MANIKSVYILLTLTSYIHFTDISVVILYIHRQCTFAVKEIECGAGFTQVGQECEGKLRICICFRNNFSCNHEFSYILHIQSLRRP